MCMDLELHQRMAARGPCECVYVCVLCLYVVFVLCVCVWVGVVHNVSVHMCMWYDD